VLSSIINSKKIQKQHPVTPQRFELQLTGPKPVVLPLDERVIFADVNGFEPLSKVLETFILPLNYTPNLLGHHHHLT